jgi:cephalosporin-C deacetylase-like acetyl esterase
MRRQTIILIALCSALIGLSIEPSMGQRPEELDFLTGLEDFRDIKSMLPAYLKGQANALLSERERKVAGLSTAREVEEHKAYIRQRILNSLGGLPDRTPLNARVGGAVERADYRIEKVIFESQPRFYVTTNLYLPKKGRMPYPAILFPLGHESGAKANAVWQQMLGTLAKKGYVALAWDPIGQGERVQLYDADWGESKVRRSTTEHTIIGIQCLLNGDSLARYTIWDGMRALDYLLSRPEVDRARIGVTGNSGGGTHTAYLAALDDRIHVAAPSCYLTSWRRLLETIGPQDAEQNLPPWLGDGLDHADFIYAFSPRPYLILSAMRDFFSIDGARATYEEAQRIYTLTGAAEKLRMVEADDGHGYSKPRRMAAYRWFGRWLKGIEDEEPEPEVELATEEELRCTESGQVATSLGGETAFSLNRTRAAEFSRTRGLSFSSRDLSGYREEIRRRVRQSTKFDVTKGPVQAKPFGELARPGYRIEKIILESEPGIVVPALLFVPESTPARKPAILYVHGRGKATGAGEIEQFVKAGFVVLAIDARGFGETQHRRAEQGSDFPGYFGDYDSAMTALLIGKPLVGMRAIDITRAIDLLSARAEVDRERIYGFGKEAGAVPLLYAAVFDERIRKVALEGMLISYQTIVDQRIHRQVFETVVPGALRSYDLPDLVGALSPRQVWVVNGVDALGHRVGIGEVRKQYARSSEAFRGSGVEASLQIAERRSDEGVAAIYRGLINRE